MPDATPYRLVSPRAWGTHPYAYGAGMLAALVLFVVLGVAFWIKGRFWP